MSILSAIAKAARPVLRETAERGALSVAGAGAPLLFGAPFAGMVADHPDLTQQEKQAMMQRAFIMMALTGGLGGALRAPIAGALGFAPSLIAARHSLETDPVAARGGNDPRGGGP